MITGNYDLAVLSEDNFTCDIGYFMIFNYCVT